MADTRPTKKQKEMLSFVENFIAGHGYGPSYREIRAGLGYRSVATVAVHIDNLIAKGYLRKKDHSARSLELVDVKTSDLLTQGKPKQVAQEKWLVGLIEQQIIAVENASTAPKDAMDKLYVLINALRILGFAEAATLFAPRISAITKALKTNTTTK